jgi:menaquinone-9 beta-reductase
VLSARYDAVVVGAGPGGSTAALVLAREGARVALVDKATFARDKACGDLIGPRGVALLAELGLDPGPGRRVGQMIVVGPTGRRVVLPARAGLTYPGYGVTVPRLRFDSWLRDAAIAAGADAVTGRVRTIGGAEGGRTKVVLGDRRHVETDVVVGADGATSVVADAAGLVDHGWVLWGFAQRAYVDQAVERPIIVLWDESPWRGFPGYGWLFPGPDGRANVGLGLGLGPMRTGASRAVVRLDAFLQHLRTLGVLTGSVEGHRLGGWLKMGMVGTTPASGRILLVGDAAGLVNPLQGEGIAPAMISGHAAARAVISGPGDAAERYLRILATGPASYASVAAAVHAASISGSARRVAGLGRALTLPGVGRTIAAPWALYWNDLLDGAPPGPATLAANVAHRAGRLTTRRSRTRRRLAQSLLAAQDPQRLSHRSDARDRHRNHRPPEQR